MMSEYLFEKIADAIGRLSLSETKVAYLIVAEPELVRDKSMAAIASLADVSEPTVMRFCRSMGFSGFSDFKESFIRQLDAGGAENLATVSQADSISNIIHKNHLIVRQQLKHLVEEVDAEELLRVCSLFHSSSVTAIFTEENLHPTAQSFHNCFLHCGCHSTLYCNPDTFVDIIRSLPQLSSLLFLSEAGQNKAMEKSITVAREKKFSSVALTKRYSPLAAEADHALYFPENKVEQTEQPNYFNSSGLLLVNTVFSILQKMK